MNDNEIIRALEWLREVMGVCSSDKEYINGNIILDLINRLTAENERLKTVHYCIDKVILGKQEFAIADEYLIAYQNALERLYNNINLKSAARKEFVERLIEEKSWDVDCRCGYVHVVDVGDIEDLLEEMEKEV